MVKKCTLKCILGKILIIPNVGRDKVKLVLLYNTEKTVQNNSTILESMLAKVWMTNTETLWPR